MGDKESGKGEGENALGELRFLYATDPMVDVDGALREAFNDSFTASPVPFSALDKPVWGIFLATGGVVLEDSIVAVDEKGRVGGFNLIGKVCRVRDRRGLLFA